MRENLSLKLISLILAVLLELYFYSPDNSLKVSLAATVEIRNVPTSLMFISPHHAERGITARVIVRGPRPLIEQAQGGNQRFILDYPQDSPLAFSASLDPRQLTLPAGVEVLEVNPPSITFELEHVVAKDLLVDVQRVGQVPTGYQLEGIRVYPDSVTVTGPESELASLRTVKTQRLSLDDLTDTKTVELPLETPGLLSRLGVPVVKAEVRVSPIPAERAFEKVNVRVLAPYGYAGTVEPSRVKATLGGPKEALSQLSANGIELEADARALSEGKHEVDLTAELPKGLVIVATEPKKVTVNLIKQ
ncbi:MAG: CdaR family protein [Bdellovibrionota bacterium]